MSFPPDFMAELRRRTQLSRLIARRVKLVKKGREFQGLCPFHTEKTPSFTVNDDKEFYHCFGCGAHGDAISFLIEIERMTFPEAVEFLASQAAMTVPRNDFVPQRGGGRFAQKPTASPPPEPHPENPPPPNTQAQTEQQEEDSKREFASLERLRATLAAALGWYQQQLTTKNGEEARDYLHRRGLNPSIIGQFSLGFAPERGGLLEALTAQNYKIEELTACGLLVQAADTGRYYEKFRHRIMFPIFDRQGRPIGFGGRALGDAKPKYLNSPDTPLFHKGQILFAHHFARTAAKTSPILVAEGYLDVISLHQHGFVGAVAPLGTALTEDQMRLLWRMNPEPFLCFDGDEAGRRASYRAALRALPQIGPGKSLRFLDMPKGLDPDEILQKPGGVATIKNLINTATPLVDKIFTSEYEAEPLATPEQKAQLRQRLRDVVREITDADTRQFYDQHFQEKLSEIFATPRGASGFVPRSLRLISKAGFELVNGYWIPIKKGLETLLNKPKQMSKVALRIELLEKPLLACLLNYPELGATLIERVGSLKFSTEPLTKLSQELLHILGMEPEIKWTELSRRLESEVHAPLLRELKVPFTRFNHLEILNPKLDFALRETMCTRLLEQAEHEEMAEEKQAYIAAFRDQPNLENWRHLLLLTPTPLADDG